jgi:hypothetical protein
MDGSRAKCNSKRRCRGALLVFASIAGFVVIGLALRRLRSGSGGPAPIGAFDPALPRPDADRVNARAASLHAEETLAGSDNPELQARTILAESDARTHDRVEPPGPTVEHRSSEETVTPIE